MKQTLLAFAATASIGTMLASHAGAQPAVDFRDVIRTVEPSLLTVTVDSNNAIEPVDGAADEDAEQDAEPAKGPRIEFFDLNGGRLNQLRGRRRGIPGNIQTMDVTSAAFAVNDSIIVAYVGGNAKTVDVENVDGERSTGTVMAYDHVTGLAAIKVDQLSGPALILSVANQEPGTPIVATWIDDGVLTADAGMISTRPAASQSGLGLTAGIDFGNSLQMPGAPVLDASGIVIGVLVPSRSGNLVCTGAANVQRLVDSATAEQPSDLKRGLVGIQFQGGGPLVLQVSANSGAEQAGIKAGDLVQQVGQLKIRDAGDVIAAVASARAGDTLEVVVRRGEETMAIPVTLTEHPQQQLARADSPGGGIQMQQAFELKDGKLVPMEIDPNANPLPPGFGRMPMDGMFRDLQRFNFPAWPAPNQQGGVEGFEIERSDVEKTLKELQRQMEQLNEKLDN